MYQWLFLFSLITFSQSVRAQDLELQRPAPKELNFICQLDRDVKILPENKVSSCTQLGIVSGSDNATQRGKDIAEWMAKEKAREIGGNVLVISNATRQSDKGWTVEGVCYQCP